MADRPIGYNPFTGSGEEPRLALSLREQIELAAAPRGPKPPYDRPGPRTRVTTYSYDIPRAKGWLPRHGWAGGPDHMYVEFDDGRETLIARGGPKGRLETVQAQVTPAGDSIDRGQGERVMFRGELPGQTAREATRAAQAHAEGVNRGFNRYGLRSNSNSYAADVVEDLFGVRPGDFQTWGHRRRLVDTPPKPTPYTDALRRPRWHP